jgi:hypothetical protein
MATGTATRPVDDPAARWRADLFDGRTLVLSAARYATSSAACCRVD